MSTTNNELFLHSSCMSVRKPGTGDQGAPGTADGRAREGTSAGNNMDREPGTGDGKPGTRDGAVPCTCVHARLLNNSVVVQF